MRSLEKKIRHLEKQRPQTFHNEPEWKIRSEEIAECLRRLEEAKANLSSEEVRSCVKEVIEDYAERGGDIG